MKLLPKLSPRAPIAGEVLKQEVRLWASANSDLPAPPLKLIEEAEKAYERVVAKALRDLTSKEAIGLDKRLQALKAALDNLHEKGREVATYLFEETLKELEGKNGIPKDFQKSNSAKALRSTQRAT